jgi:hypothetical protein
VNIKEKYYWKKLVKLRKECRILKKARNSESGCITCIGKIKKSGLNKKITQIENEIIYYEKKLWTEEII